MFLRIFKGITTSLGLKRWAPALQPFDWGLPGGRVAQTWLAAWCAHLGLLVPRNCGKLKAARRCCHVWILFFPTCQVRVVRFYQSCCPPPPPPPSPPPPPPSPPPVSPRPCLHQLPPPLPPCQLFAKLFAKLFANFPAQCALLDLNLGPSQLSAHRWTSTWDLPSSVRTAAPQPGTCRAQCAPLDLNLGPSELSAHRRTSKAR